MNTARPACALIAVLCGLACSSAPVAPLSDPADRDAAPLNSQDGGPSDAGPAKPERPDVGAQCGVIEGCNCKDGTHAVAGCIGPATCEQACANHGGLEPEGQCADGQTSCQSECVDLEVGSGGGYNCGACGVICPEYSSCSAGICKVSLPADAGRFACRRDSDCQPGEDCVLNANSNCPPVCAKPCALPDGGVMEAVPACNCGAAIDVGTSAHLEVCFPAGGGC